MAKVLEILGPDGRKEAEIPTEAIAAMGKEEYEAMMKTQQMLGRTFTNSDERPCDSCKHKKGMANPKHGVKIQGGGKCTRYQPNCGKYWRWLLEQGGKK